MFAEPVVMKLDTFLRLYDKGLLSFQSLGREKVNADRHRRQLRYKYCCYSFDFLWLRLALGTQKYI
jgi:hypothetical protein